MKLLVMHRVPYRKIEYHRGLDHRRHDVTYIGSRLALAQIPKGLPCRKVTLPGARPASEEILARITPKDGFELVVSLSEFELLEAAKVREVLGIRGPRVADALKVRDKMIMKELVGRAGIRVPLHFAAAAFLEGDFQVESALVVKPTRGASSEGVEVHRGAAAARRRLGELAASGTELSEYEVEEFVEGAIVHVDGLVRSGKIQALVASRYVGTCLEYLAGKPLGSHQLRHSRAVQAWTGRCLEALGISDGAFHVELIENPGGPVFLEAANRVGGADVIRTFEAKTGIHIPSAELQILTAARHGRPSRLPALTGRKRDRGLYGWFIFPGHQHVGRKVRTVVPGWIAVHPGLRSLTRLPDGAPHPAKVTYQDWEVPVAGFVRGKDQEGLRLLIENCIKAIDVRGI